MAEYATVVTMGEKPLKIRLKPSRRASRVAAGRPEASRGSNNAAVPRDSSTAAVARAAMAAIEPVVELLLDLGVTSPEAESLLRSLFIHRSRAWLARQNGGEIPSDVHIALVTGVHRNFVSRLLAEPPKIAAARARKGHRATRLLLAWHSEPMYLDSSGKPRDLAERGPAPSFEALANRSVPGSAPGVVLQELHRAGVVQRLADQRVRVRSRSMRVPGVNPSSITAMGKLAQALLETAMQNLRADSQERVFCESMPPIDVNETRVALVREVINRRASAFLQSLEAELASESRRPPARKGGKRVKISLTVFEAISSS